MEQLSILFKRGVKEAQEKVSALSGGRMSVVCGEAKLAKLEDAGALIGGEDETVVGVGMTLLGEPPLKYLMLMSPEARVTIAETVGGPGAGDDDELADSVLQELGNILGSTVANSLSRMAGQPITTSVPEVVADLAGALVSTVICSVAYIDDTILLLDISIVVDGQKLKCGIYLFFGGEFESILKED